jgi:hypothetical protein
MVYILEASVTGNSHGKTGGPIAKGEHIDEGETGEHNGGNSAQHMLHCMSQYNNRTLRTKGWSTRGVGENQRPELN